MIKIDRKPYGYSLTFARKLSKANLDEWLKESELVLADSPKSFFVLIDMRSLELLPAEFKYIMFEGQKLYKRMGMERSVVVVADKLTALQFRLIAQKTGIFSYERYIDASTNLNWEKEALNWLLNAVEPTVEELVAQ